MRPSGPEGRFRESCPNSGRFPQPVQARLTLTPKRCHPQPPDSPRRVTARDEQVALPPVGRIELSPGPAKRSPGLPPKKTSSPVGALRGLPEMGCSLGAAGEGSAVASYRSIRSKPRRQADCRVAHISIPSHGPPWYRRNPGSENPGMHTDRQPKITYTS